MTKQKSAKAIVSIYIPLSLKTWLEVQAAKEQRSLSNVVVRLLEQMREENKM